MTSSEALQPFYFLGWAISAMGSASRKKNSPWLPFNISYELERNLFAILCILACVSPSKICSKQDRMQVD